MNRYLIVLAGAGLGGLARYVVSSYVMARYGGRFPLGTLAVNVIGCFLVGLLMSLFTERWQPHPLWRLFLVVGVLGGYTTFSTFGYETWQGVRDGSYGLAALNAAGSVLLGCLAVHLGAQLGGR